MGLSTLLQCALLALGLSLSVVHAESASDAAASAITPRGIIERAHAAAGGALWTRPKTLYMRGRAKLYSDGTPHSLVEVDDYQMWREFPAFNRSAHDANGKVRIDAKRGSEIVFTTAFDGSLSYNQHGVMPGAKASQEWNEAFGFGIIRFALGKDFQLTRKTDDEIESEPCFVVEVRDPSGTATTFWIDQSGFEIRRVGFETPKGWHERTYSEFFRLSNGWLQPGRVRLRYRGVLFNDVYWSHAEVNAPIPLERFQVSR
jgi:hypothetical protein